MSLLLNNIFEDLPNNLQSEVIEDIVKSDSLRIERIISKGHTTPPSQWFDQEQNEWVIVLQGEAIIDFEEGDEQRMLRGSYLNIPAHCRHRVKWTKPETETVWLAIHY